MAMKKKLKARATSRKHVGDVIGLGRSTAKARAGTRKRGGKPKGIELVTRRRSRTLKPARVKG